jgi:signal peptidase I
MQSLGTDTTIEKRVIPAWALAAGLSRCFVYRGSSMTPTFRPGHLLYVRPTACDINPGDVVVFAGPSKKDYVVHRVVAATDVGLITRGDNNSRYDPPVVLDQVIGRVEMVEDQGYHKPVRGGSRGLWSARIRWRVLQLGRWLRHIFSAPYRALRRFELMHRALNWLFFRQLKVVRLQTSDGPFFIVTHKQRIVARWWPQQGRFECKKPYDLVIRREDLAQQAAPSKSRV